MMKIPLISTVLAVHVMTAGVLVAQSNWNPYGQTPYNANSNSGSDVPAGIPNSSAENKYTQETQERYRQMNAQNQNMIDRDRMMMRKGYDPNETYNYSQRQGDSQINVPYPQNQPGPLRNRFDNAETLIQGSDSTNPQGQNAHGVGTNPYLNNGKPPQSTTPDQGGSPQRSGQ